MTDKTPEERIVFHLFGLTREQAEKLVAEHSVQILQSAEGVLEAIEDGSLQGFEPLEAVRTLIAEASIRAGLPSAVTPPKLRS